MWVSGAALPVYTQMHLMWGYISLDFSSALNTGVLKLAPPSAVRPSGRGNRRGVWSLDNMSSEAAALLGPCVNSAED